LVCLRPPGNVRRLTSPASRVLVDRGAGLTKNTDSADSLGMPQRTPPGAARDAGQHDAVFNRFLDARCEALCFAFKLAATPDDEALGATYTDADNPLTRLAFTWLDELTSSLRDGVRLPPQHDDARRN